MTVTSYLTAVTRVVDAIAADPALVGVIAEAVRDGVPEISSLSEDEVAEQARLILVSGLDAFAEPRPLTSPELDHVAKLAGVCARRRVPVTALLSSIHIGQHIALKAIADRLAETERDVPPNAVMDAFVAHLRWAQSIESRIISAHREAEIVAAREAYDQEIELLRALVEGPVLAGHRDDLAARGFALGSDLWVLRTQADGQLVRSVVDLGTVTLQARLADEHVMVTDQHKARRPPCDDATLTVTVAVAGPVRPEGLPGAYQLAGRVLAAAERQGSTGLHSVSTVATEMIRFEHPEIGRALAREHLGGLNPEDEWARVLVETLLVHLDTGQRLDATAAELFVHPNTIRHRMRRLEELTGVVPQSRMGERVKVWWAARAWLDKSQALAAARSEG